ALRPRHSHQRQANPGRRPALLGRLRRALLPPSGGGPGQPEPGWPSDRCADHRRPVSRPHLHPPGAASRARISRLRAAAGIRGELSSAMDVAAFNASLAQEKPPRGISAALAGLWWDAKGNWTEAHEAAQRQEDAAGAWVHAYLHRKE